MRFRTMTVGLGFLLLAGCGAPKQDPSIMPPITPPQAYVEPEERYDNPGSLYQSGGTDTLFADTRAHRVGDIVMVKIVENNKAKNKATMDSNKDQSNSYGVDAFFGKSQVGMLPGGGGAKMPVGGIGFGTTSVSELSSDGETKREGTVTATLAARVTRLLPGGLMQIEGARETKVNGETQYLVVTGLIRPMDVSPDNTITSNRIADAQIAYYGKGVISDTQKPGWFTRLMNNVWPF